MSLRRPHNIMSGLSSGMQSVGKGVLGGAAALIAAPVVGARSEGWYGFAKGLGAGLAAAVALHVAGAAVGITQIARGAYNTPEAIMEANAGKRWDSHRRVWVAEDLVQESLKLSECSDDDILEKARERAKARGEAPGLEGALGVDHPAATSRPPSTTTPSRLRPPPPPARSSERITYWRGNYTRIRTRTIQKRTRSSSASARRTRC